MRMRALVLPVLMAALASPPVVAKEFNQPKRLRAGDQMLINNAELKSRIEARKQRSQDGTKPDIGGKNIIFNDQCGDQNIGNVAAGARAPRNLIISADAIINSCRR